jgi:hypothetical protein
MASLNADSKELLELAGSGQLKKVWAMVAMMDPDDLAKIINKGDSAGRTPAWHAAKHGTVSVIQM